VRVFRRRRTTLGIDFAPGLARLVLVDHTWEEARLLRALTVPTGTEAATRADGSGFEELRSVIERIGPPAGPVVAAVDGEDAFVRLIEVTPTVEGVVGERAMREVGVLFPADLDDLVVRTQTVDGDGSGAAVRVLVSAASREAIDRKIALVTEIGLRRPIIDLEPIALFNALEASDPLATLPRGALIDVGAMRLTAVLFENGVPLTAASHLVDGWVRGSAEAEGGADRTDSLQPSDPTPTRSERFEAEVPMEILVASVDVALRSLVPSGPIWPGLPMLYLSGERATVPGLAEMIADRTGTGVTVVNPVRGLRPTGGAMADLGDERAAPALARAIGLALRVRA